MKSIPEKLIPFVTPFLIQEKIINEWHAFDEKWLAKAIATLQERSKTLIELAHSLSYYIADDVEYNVKAKDKFLNEKYLVNLTEVRKSLGELDDFSVPEIEKVFVSVAKKQNTKLGNIAQPVRVAVTGKTESPGIFEVLEIVGKERTLQRLDKAIKMIHAINL
jgi:glutamyl-tRNA synthetase